MSPTFLATFRYSLGRYSSDTTYTAQRQDPSVLKIPDIITRNALFSGWPRIRMAEQFAGFGGRVNTGRTTRIRSFRLSRNWRGITTCDLATICAW